MAVGVVRRQKEAQPGKSEKMLGLCTRLPASDHLDHLPQMTTRVLPLCLDCVIWEVCRQQRGPCVHGSLGSLPRSVPGLALGGSSHPRSPGSWPRFCLAACWSVLTPLRLTVASEGRRGSFSFQVRKVGLGEQALGCGWIWTVPLQCSGTTCTRLHLRPCPGLCPC